MGKFHNSFAKQIHGDTSVNPVGGNGATSNNFHIIIAKGSAETEWDKVI